MRTRLFSKCLDRLQMAWCLESCHTASAISKRPEISGGFHTAWNFSPFSNSLTFQSFCILTGLPRPFSNGLNRTRPFANGRSFHTACNICTTWLHIKFHHNRPTSSRDTKRGAHVRTCSGRQSFRCSLVLSERWHTAYKISVQLVQPFYF